MFGNYLKSAWRNLVRHKAFTAINIAGLAIAMAGVILIGIWIQNELGYDRFFKKEKDLYIVMNRYTDPEEISVGDVTAGPIARTLERDFPEVRNAARIYWSSERLFNFGDKNIKAKGNEVDSPFLSIFSFPLLQGNANHALDDIHDMVITENFSRKLFGDQDPMNKTVIVDGKDNYKITGILKPLPSNTQFDFDFLTSLKANEITYGGGSWSNNTFYTYVQLQPNTDIKTFNEKIKNVVEQNSKNSWQLFLYPFSQVHLYSEFENGKPSGGRIETVRLMGLIGVLILLIACFNFINLSTAQSQKRAKEVGVRKVIGAGKGNLIGQFLSESLLMVAVAGVIAVGIATYCLPYFNQLIEGSLSINFSSPVLYVALIGFVAFTGLLAGSYPAFFLSAFSPAKVLKGAVGGAKSRINPRKILVILQFSVGIVLVISALIIYQQINFVQSRNTGYNMQNLIEVPIEGDVSKNYNLIKNELLNRKAVTAMSKTGWTTTLDGSNGSGFTWGGEDQKSEEAENFSIFRTEGNFAKTIGAKISAGRDIDLANFTMDSSSVMINSTAAKIMGLKDPIGKLIKRGDQRSTIVGVFDDFIIGSPYENISPMLVFGSRNWNFNLIMRLNKNRSTAQNLQIAEKVFKTYNPDYPFTYRFVDQEYAEKFKTEKQTATISALFAALSIFISCLGLFGLAAFMAENRSKEIGIRKVLGANVVGIAKMLSREFLILVSIAILIATPVGWWAMNKWLQDFVYRINISWATFAIAGIVALLIALITVSFQAIKAAMANPVESLRSE